jgi:hypothetical protein
VGFVASKSRATGVSERDRKVSAASFAPSIAVTASPSRCTGGYDEPEATPKTSRSWTIPEAERHEQELSRCRPVRCSPRRFLSRWA